MAIDLGRVASKAIETALEHEQQDGDRRRHSRVRTLAAGAALAVAARAAIARRHSLAADLAELRDIPDRVRDRLADSGWLDGEQVEEDELVEDDDLPEAEAEDDEEPDDEEDPDDEVDDAEEEPEAEEEPDDDQDDLEDEPEAAAEPGGDVEDEDDDELDEDEEDDELEDEEEPPELSLDGGDDEPEVHPEARPPKPPRSRSTAKAR